MTVVFVFPVSLSPSTFSSLLFLSWPSSSSSFLFSLVALFVSWPPLSFVCRSYSQPRIKAASRPCISVAHLGCALIGAVSRSASRLRISTVGMTCLPRIWPHFAWARHRFQMEGSRCHVGGRRGVVGGTRCDACGGARRGRGRGRRWRAEPQPGHASGCSRACRAGGGSKGAAWALRPQSPPFLRLPLVSLSLSLLPSFLPFCLLLLHRLRLCGGCAGPACLDLLARRSACIHCISISL